MRTRILTAIGIGLLAGLVGAAEPGVGRDVLEKHAKEVAAAVPAGWAVRVDADGTDIWIERKLAVPVIDTRPNGPGHAAGEPPLMRSPAFVLWVGPLRSQAEVAVMQKGNADREKALAMMRTQMKDLEAVVMPSGETESYVARTPEQQARLDAFVTVKRALPNQRVPEWFATDASFNSWDDGFAPLQEADRAEMDAVRRKVEALFATKPLK